MSFQRIPFGEFTKRHDIADKRFDEVAALINPQPTGPWLVGGAVRRLLNGDTQSSDFDVAFPGEKELVELRERLILAGFKVATEKPEHIELHGKLGDHKTTIQLLRVAFRPTCEAVLDTFDFTICMLGYDGSDIIAGPYTLWDLGRKKLAVHRITYAAASVRRMLKYSKQGFQFCQGTIVSVLEEVAKEPGVIRGEVTYVD